MNTSQTQHTRFLPYLATTAYYLSLIILGLTMAASGPSLPTLVEHTSSSLDRISLIFIFGSLGYVIGSYVGGRAYDRYSGHKILATSLLIIAIASILIPIARSLEFLLFAMFLSGLASGGLDTGCNTLIMWAHGEKAGPFLNGLHFFFGVGSLTAPLLLAQVLLRTGDINWVYWIFSIVSVPIMVWLWFLPEPNRSIMDEEKNSTFSIVPVLLVVILFLLYVGLELGFGNWIYTYSLTLGLGTTISAAFLNSAFWGSFTLGRLLAVWISTRLRPQTILFMDILGCTISTIIIMLWKDSTSVLWIGTIGLGISMASIFPTLIILAGERMHITGAITGWFLVGSGIGSMLLPWVIGQIFVRTGPKAMTTVLLVDLAGILLFLLLFINLRLRSLPAPAISD